MARTEEHRFPATWASCGLTLDVDLVKSLVLRKRLSDQGMAKQDEDHLGTTGPAIAWEEIRLGVGDVVLGLGRIKSASP